MKWENFGNYESNEKEDVVRKRLPDDWKKSEKRRKKRRRKKKWNGKLFGTLIAVGVLLALTLLFVCFYFSIQTRNIEVKFQDDAVLIEWELINADECRVYLYDEEKQDYAADGKYQDCVIQDGTIENGAILKTGDAEEINLSLQAVKIVNLFGHQIPISGRSRQLTIQPMDEIKLYSYAIPDEKIAFLLWQEEEGCEYEIYCMNDNNLWETTNNNIIMLDFKSEFSVPDRNNPFWAAIRVVRREKDYTAYGPISEYVMISRNDLLADNLALSWEQVEARQYVLRWQESYGELYEIQQWSEEQNRWISKCILNSTQEMMYQTDHLPSNAQVRFRVITYNSEEEAAQEIYQTEPSEVTLHTDISTLYCTIWPVMQLKIMDQPQGGNVLGEVPAGEALCVLGEESGYFKIRYRNWYGYINSDFCMINLPEYLGDLCEYDITNSISSIFRVHEYDIPEVTGGVVQGYENVCLGYENYLVPYLYPCTEKLYQAALAAAEDGYGLRIYDAFRPNEATAYLYETVGAILEDPVPFIIEEDEEGEGDEEGTVSGQTVEEELPENGQNEETADETGMTEEGGITDETGMTEEGETASEEGIEGGVWPTDPVTGEPMDSYRMVMTDEGRYRLSSFLAPTVSNHNRGIALDLTLIDAETKEDLPMQTQIHDLSFYSVTGYNNENAVLLAQYMKGAGYNDLVTEWWHFQDDETRNRLGTQFYLTEGVSVEGWKKDDNGWKYRLEDGSYYENITVAIDGREYTFDGQGYCMEEE